MSTQRPVVCPNINPLEQRKRLIAGGAQGGIAATVLAVLLARGTDRRWRLLLGPLFFGAAAGVFQWRGKT